MKYLKNLILHNVGPIENLSIRAEYDSQGNPKPIVFVGTNGSGKTIALTTVVDALHELAAGAGFSDVCMPDVGGGRKYFRVSGGGLQKSGSQKYVGCATFGAHSETGHLWKYYDKAGDFEETEWNSVIEGLLPYPGASKQNDKQSSFTDAVQGVTPAQAFDKSVFQKSAFCYFPANRSERPFWSTEPSQTERVHDGLNQFSNQLGKPITCTETSFHNATWLMDVILDDLAQDHAGKINLERQVKEKLAAGSNFELNELVSAWTTESLTAFQNANQLLSVLLGYSARFAVMPRQSNKRLHFTRKDIADFESLHISHLSHGQSSLLGIFCTIMRYADAANNLSLADIEGLVLIDEADAGLHIEYQREVLPKLMRLMPKVQFIISTHSPLLLLGLENQYGVDGVQIIETPSGNRLSAEAFPEFKAVYSTLESTKTFKTSLDDLIQKEGQKPVLLVEGQSDEILLRAAWKALRATEFPFSVGGKLDRTHLRLVLSDIGKTGLTTTLPILALWDFDEAFSDWETLVNKKNPAYREISGREDASGLICKHIGTKQVFGALLPIPDFRTVQASRFFGKKSALTMELLFKDSYLKALDAIEELLEVGGGKIVRVKTQDKIKLAESLSLLDKAAFQNFEPMLKMLSETLLTQQPEVTAVTM